MTNDFEKEVKMSDGFFPPPWNMSEHPEKTEGWIEFQKAMRKDPKYYNENDPKLNREEEDQQIRNIIIDSSCYLDSFMISDIGTAPPEQT